jgi:hypothetical protein
MAYAQFKILIVPTLQRGNAVCDAPASRNAGALLDEFPRRSVGTIKIKEKDLFESPLIPAFSLREKGYMFWNQPSVSV